jgi:hypothetical protein
MTLAEYLTKPENPVPASPAAVLMLRILAKDPAADHDEAQFQAQRPLVA